MTTTTTIRAKLTVTEEAKTRYGQNRLKFQADYDQNIPEDQRFQKATPSATAEFWIDNPVALDFFKLGGTYYCDFIEAPKPAAAE